MKTKHTPGPWKAYKWDDGTACVSAPFFSGDERYGSFDIVTGIRPAIDRLKDEQEANARLIAVAPELLETLQRIENRLAREGSILDFSNTEAESIRALIAKAKP